MRNYLVDGGSGTGKTAVCEELRRRGYQAFHGDRELRGAAESAEVEDRYLPPSWDVAKVKRLIAGQDERVTFFCGGCRNSSEFVELLDGVFVLEVGDLEEVMRRVDERVRVDPSDWGGRPEEREIIMRLHHTKQGIAQGCAIDATAPLEAVVDEILRHVHSRPGSDVRALAEPS